MAFTAAVIFFIVSIGVISIIAGHYTEHPELYFLGVVALLFMGLILIAEGYQYQTGQLVHIEDSVGPENQSVADENVTYVYGTEQDVYTNGLGLLLILAAAGLSLTWWKMTEKRRQEARESIEL